MILLLTGQRHSCDTDKESTSFGPNIGVHLLRKVFVAFRICRRSWTPKTLHSNTCCKKQCGPANSLSPTYIATLRLANAQGISTLTRIMLAKPLFAGLGSDGSGNTRWGPLGSRAAAKSGLGIWGTCPFPFSFPSTSYFTTYRLPDEPRYKQEGKRDNFNI